MKMYYHNGCFQRLYKIINIQAGSRIKYPFKMKFYIFQLVFEISVIYLASLFSLQVIIYNFSNFRFPSSQLRQSLLSFFRAERTQNNKTVIL